MSQINIMNIQVILTVTMLLTLAVDAPTIASAQGFSNYTLEEAMKLLEYIVSVSPPNDQPDPYFMILVGTFIGLGIIATVFFIKRRSGKYAAVGRR